ncbi:uncharacterized protein LOC112589141 [Harpegnathos saltator]|uniref:uncharacterized protein LOC112589141 n=1 Tax=Harpegnathos saltator TaxID=610380 RepID=UPI000DBED8EF|nr:uncharacterized protein LOC112589141 [Harpegnathos saltator]
MVDGVCVRVGSTIKYLGLTLDGRWNFGAHFKALAPRVRKAGLALASLTKTQGGSRWHAHRLYVGMVLSTALHGAPIWAPRLMASGRCKALLRQTMRPVVVRTVRGTKELRVAGKELSARDLGALKSQAETRVLERWSEMLSDPRGFELRTAEAVRPCLPEMMGRMGRGLTFHMVQVLTEHECFGRYLHWIGREPTAGCHHCQALEDTVQHILAECQAWADQRRVLT